MKRFLAAALGTVTVIVVACGGSSQSDIADTSGGGADSGSAEGSVNGGDSGGTTGNGDSGGGTTDSGGGGSDAGTSGGEGGVKEAGTPCTIDGTGASVGCGAKEYCLSNDCTTGICVPVPSHANSNNYSPQCGCDGVTYWNKEWAAFGGESISSNGVCTASTTPKALACQTGVCPKGAGYGCASELTNCMTLPPQIPQTCWFLPAAGQCPDSPKVQSCGGAVSLDGGVSCVGLCGAIDNKTVFARNVTCN